MSDNKLQIGTPDFNKSLVAALGLDGEHVTKLTVMFSADACPVMVIEKLTEDWRAEKLIGIFGDMPPPTKWIPVLTEDFAIRSVPIGDGDKLVVRCDSPVTRDARDRIAAMVKEWAGDHEVLVLQPGMSIDVVKDITNLDSSSVEHCKLKVSQ